MPINVLSNIEKKVRKDKLNIKREKIRKDIFYKKVRNKIKTEGDRFEGSVDVEVMGFCMKCGRKTPIKDAYKVTFKNKIKVFMGECTICDTKIYKRRT